MHYFDHNATHPLSQTAKAAWIEATERYPANPSSPHRWGARAAHAIEQAREQLAGFLGCPVHEITWTSGATESNNLILRHLAAQTQGPVLVSSIEHPSIRTTARSLLGQRAHEIPVHRNGVVDVPWIQQRLSSEPVAAVIVMAANNETGVVQPWQLISDACRQARVPYVCDAAQWLGKRPAAGLGQCTIVTGCAHKFGGPLGVGFIKAPADLLPLHLGGPQEDGRRAGTENVPGILSMLAALQERETLMAPPQPVSPAESGPDSIEVRMRQRDHFVQALKAALPDVEVVGEGTDRLWNTVAALMPAAADCRRRWVVKLDRLGFAVSTGSACSSGKEQPSHVLSAMGYRPDQSDRMLRFSAGWETTESDWSALLDAILLADRELRSTVDVRPVS